jgi:hypothetical protein
MKSKSPVQREIIVKGHSIIVGMGSITGTGYIAIADYNIYLENDSRAERAALGYDNISTLMARRDMEALYKAIGEILEQSK